MQNDYPVILLITGKIKYKEKLTGVEKTTKLHNVNILEMQIDRIMREVKVTCASWSEPIVIDLYECFTSDFCLYDLNIDIDVNLELMTRLYLQIGHCIVVNEDIL